MKQQAIQRVIILAPVSFLIRRPVTLKPTFIEIWSGYLYYQMILEFLLWIFFFPSVLLDRIGARLQVHDLYLTALAVGISASVLERKLMLDYNNLKRDQVIVCEKYFSLCQSLP